MRKDYYELWMIQKNRQNKTVLNKTEKTNKTRQDGTKSRKDVKRMNNYKIV